MTLPTARNSLRLSDALDGNHFLDDDSLFLLTKSRYKMALWASADWNSFWRCIVLPEFF